MLLRITGIEYYHGSATKVPFYTGYHKGFKLVPVTLVSLWVIDTKWEIYMFRDFFAKYMHFF